MYTSSKLHRSFVTPRSYAYTYHLSLLDQIFISSISSFQSTVTHVQQEQV